MTVSLRRTFLSPCDNIQASTLPCHSFDPPPGTQETVVLLQGNIFLRSPASRAKDIPQGPRSTPAPASGNIVWSETMLMFVSSLYKNFAMDRAMHVPSSTPAMFSDALPWKYMMGKFAELSAVALWCMDKNRSALLSTAMAARSLSGTATSARCVSSTCAPPASNISLR